MFHNGTFPIQLILVLVVYIIYIYIYWIVPPLKHSARLYVSLFVLLYCIYCFQLTLLSKFASSFQAAVDGRGSSSDGIEMNELYGGARIRCASGCDACLAYLQCYVGSGSLIPLFTNTRGLLKRLLRENFVCLPSFYNFDVLLLTVGRFPAANSSFYEHARGF